MTTSLESLRLFQLRPGVLFAMDLPGRWMPLMLCAGMSAWLAGVLGWTGMLPLDFSLGLAMVGLAWVILAPMLMIRATWLTIDLSRGWIHVRRRWGSRLSLDSFSPNRLVGLSLRYEMSAIPLFRVWYVVLRIDHPRLREVALGSFLFRRRALGHALTIAEALGLPIEGESFVPVPPPITPCIDALGRHPDGQSIPPDILAPVNGRAPCLRIPNLIGFTSGTMTFLGYALIWCLWSWTSLALQVRAMAADGQTETGRLFTITLLSLVSLGGLVLLQESLIRLAGWQTLKRTPKGWSFAYRWIRWDWRCRPLTFGPGVWIRRVDRPPDQVGLWVPDRGEEIQLAPGHNVDTLSWLLYILLHPEAVHGASGNATGDPLPADLSVPNGSAK